MLFVATPYQGVVEASGRNLSPYQGVVGAFEQTNKRTNEQ
jgi:hypothetical protein